MNNWKIIYFDSAINYSRTVVKELVGANTQLLVDDGYTIKSIEEVK